MGDTFALVRTLETTAPASAVIVGAGYIGLEMADALTARGLAVIQMEQLPEVLPTVDPGLGAHVHAELARHGAEVLTGTTVRRIGKASPGQPGRLRVHAATTAGQTLTRLADLVLVVTGVRPDSGLAASAGARLGAAGAIAVDRGMRTSLPGVYAAGDCVITHHRLLGETYLPLGTTAHKQGRVAGENAAGGARQFAGSLGTQVVKIFEYAAARTGLRDHEAAAAGYDPVPAASEADDHKAYYPGSHRIAMGHRRPPHRAAARHAAARHAAVRAQACRDRQADRHRRDRDLPRHDRRRAQRPRSVLHPAAGQPLGGRSDGRPGLDPPGRPRPGRRRARAVRTADAPAPPRPGPAAGPPGRRARLRAPGTEGSTA
jgi:NADPH-dependent 2,4-dienoyl-CoA reductase/sulfur reductase-like enzyme